MPIVNATSIPVWQRALNQKFFEPAITLLLKTKTEVMQKVITFDQINYNAAGIDIGSEKFFVSVDGVQAENFETYTSDQRNVSLAVWRRLG